MEKKTVKEIACTNPGEVKKPGKPTIDDAIASCKTKLAQFGVEEARA